MTFRIESLVRQTPKVVVEIEIKYKIIVLLLSGAKIEVATAQGSRLIIWKF